jgi:hypothetical protein
MVYFARKGNGVVHHTDLNAMRDWDGVEPEAQLTEAEFLSYENLVRLINGEIFFGKTPKEKADEGTQKRIDEIDAALRNIDSRSAGRSLRAAVLAIKDNMPSSVSGDIQVLEALEEKAQELRAERAQKSALLSASTA